MSIRHRCEAFRVNTFSAKLKIVVWDCFHFQYFKKNYKAKNRINQRYLLTLGHWLNTLENSEVQAQKPPLKRWRLSLDCTIFCVAHVPTFIPSVCNLG